MGRERKVREELYREGGKRDNSSSTGKEGRRFRARRR